MKSQSSFLFWQKWLFYTSVLYALFGFVFAVYGNNIFFMPYNNLLANIFWNTSTIPPEIEPFRAFIWGSLGGTIACCYILLAFIAYYPFKRKEIWARNAIIVAFGVWIILDSTLCFIYKVYPQIYIVNLFSLITKSLPLIFTWKHFKNPNLN